MRRATRGPRAGRFARGGLLLAGAAVAICGVPIEAARVAQIVPPGQPITVRAGRARLAFRPLPTIVASDVHVSFDDRVRADLPSVSIILGLRGVLRGEATWSRARLRNGSVLSRAVPGGVPVRCDGLRGSLVAVDPRHVRVDVFGDCTSRRVALRAVRFRGSIDSRRRAAVRATGRVTSERPTVADVAGSALTATVRAGADGLRLDDLRLAIGGGTVVGRGRWLRDGDRRRLAIVFEGSGGAAEEAFDETPLRIEGRWVVRGRGRAIALGGTSIGRGASGHGRLVLLEGSVEPLDVGDALLDGLEVWRGGRRRRLRRRFPDVFGGPRLRYDRAVVTVRARRGRYDFAPIRMRSRSYAADGHGRYGRDGLVRGEIHVVPSEPLADALIGRGALRAIVAGDRRNIVLPIEVTGRPGALKVRPARAFAREVLERALGGSALGRALERLVDR